MDKIPLGSIQDALDAEDVEGLLEAGAPDDEYGSEAAMIAERLANVGASDGSEEQIIAVISAVWSRMFNRSPSELEMRRPAFRRIARQILRLPP
jgi:hypothetical protein